MACTQQGIKYWGAHWEDASVQKAGL